MKESYMEGLADHPGPESCADRSRKAASEALTGESAGQPLSCEIRQFRVPTRLSRAEGYIKQDESSEPCENPAQVKTLCMRGNSTVKTTHFVMQPISKGLPNSKAPPDTKALFNQTYTFYSAQASFDKLDAKHNAGTVLDFFNTSTESGDTRSTRSPPINESCSQGYRSRMSQIWKA